MPRTRRDFLTKSSLSLMGAAMAAKTASAKQTPSTPGAPPAFGTSAPVGPAVSVQTFQEAQKLVQIEMTPHDLAQAAGNWQQSMASVYERRTGPRKLVLESDIVPATVWNPLLPTNGERKPLPCSTALDINEVKVIIDAVGPPPPADPSASPLHLDTKTPDHVRTPHEDLH